MKGVGPEVAAPWLDPEFARSWAEADRSSYLDLPRAMVGVLASMGAEPVALIVDVASGPGDFLAALLDHFPDAAGVWTDASEAMLALARENLARFGSRVSTTWQT